MTTNTLPVRYVAAKPLWLCILLDLESPSQNLESLRQVLESPSQNLESLRQTLSTLTLKQERVRHHTKFLTLQANQQFFPKRFRIKLPVQEPDFENSNFRREILSLQTEIGNRLWDLLLEHYKSLANTIEAKIESARKSMYNKVESSSLSIKDKQRLTKMIENKITPIENRANKLRNQLREKWEKKASKNNVRVSNPQSPRHPNGKCGNKLAFQQKQAAHHRFRFCLNPTHTTPISYSERYK